MGMSSIPSSVGSMLNSGLTQQGNQQGPGNPSIGMPYGPGYTDPNQQKGPGDVSIGLPAGPGYMQPSSGGKGGMPAPVQGGFEPQFSFPSTMENPATARPYDIRDFPGYPGGTPVAGMPGVSFGMGGIEQSQFNPQPGQPTFSDERYRSPVPDMPYAFVGPLGDLGNPSIGLPAGPGYMQPTPLPTPKPITQPLPLPAPTATAQPLPLPSPKPTPAPINMQGRIGLPAGPGFMQPKPAPVVKPVPRPAPVPQTMQQIRSQVGIRPTASIPTKVQQPIQPARPTGRIGRR